MDASLQLDARKPAFRTTTLRTRTLDARTRIGMDSDYEVRGWCDELGCSYQQLRVAVSTVGFEVEKVCAFLAAR